MHYQTHAKQHFIAMYIFYNRIFRVLSLLLCIFKKILNKIYLGFSNLDRNFSFSLYSCLSLDFNIKFILYIHILLLKYCTLKCIAFNKFLRNSRYLYWQAWVHIPSPAESNPNWESLNVMQQWQCSANVCLFCQWQWQPFRFLAKELWEITDKVSEVGICVNDDGGLRLEAVHISGVDAAGFLAGSQGSWGRELNQLFFTINRWRKFDI